jgi:hypothetical protein
MPVSSGCNGEMCWGIPNEGSDDSSEYITAACGGQSLVTASDENQFAVWVRDQCCWSFEQNDGASRCGADRGTPVESRLSTREGFEFSVMWGEDGGG